MWKWFLRVHVFGSLTGEMMLIAKIVGGKAIRRTHRTNSAALGQLKCVSRCRLQNPILGEIQPGSQNCAELLWVTQFPGKLFDALFHYSCSQLISVSDTKSSGLPGTTYDNDCVMSPDPFPLLSGHTARLLCQASFAKGMIILKIWGKWDESREHGSPFLACPS